MSNSSAKQRLEAIGNQLEPVKTVTTESNGPRAKDKVIIITGANSLLGIGRATAHQFCQNGARAVYICDVSDTHLTLHQKELATLYPGTEVHMRMFDAAQEEGVKAVVGDAVERYGRLDVFFANAGVLEKRLRKFWEEDVEEVETVLGVNCLSVFLAAKHSVPAMKLTSASKPEAGGSIVATASVAGLRSNAGPTAYSASKAAVINMVQTMAYQLAGTGIRANAVCPGLIETGMTSQTYDAARKRGTEGKIGQLNPTRRGGCADEIARVALFLGSDEASYVNGQAWAVDGGLSAGLPFVAGKLG